MPIVKKVKSNDLNEILQSGSIKLLALNLNCVKNQETHQEFFTQFPELKYIDDNFELPALYRLGDYSVATTESGLAFLLFYTHLDKTSEMEIAALKSCLKKLSGEAINSGNYISFAMLKPKDAKTWDIVQKLLSFQEYLLITIIEND
jgi:hypothetical protein